MTPREKAEELFIKYRYAIRTKETESGYFTNVIYAKECALIAVDEILKSNPIMPLSYMLESEALDAGIDYWQEVKQEIEKL